VRKERPGTGRCLVTILNPGSSSPKGAISKHSNNDSTFTIPENSMILRNNGVEQPVTFGTSTRRWCEQDSADVHD
jgi:hypothetical protein